MEDLSVSKEDAGVIMDAATGEVKRVPVVEVKIDAAPVEQTFYFIGEKDESTGMFSISMPFNSMKGVIHSGLITKRSTVFRFSIPL